MNTNIVELVKDYLTDQLRNKITTAINTDQTLTNSALNAVIPGLLNSFLNASSNPSRSAALFTAVSNQNGAILNSFEEILSTNNYIQLASAGTNTLSNAIGSTITNNLAGAVANHSGLGRGSSASLLGLLTPVILAILKQQLLDSGDFSARNLTDMLNWQQDTIKSALPRSFISLDETTISMPNSEVNTNSAHGESSQGTVSTPNKSSRITSFFLAKVMPLLLFTGVLFTTYTLFFKQDNNPDLSATSTSLTKVQRTKTEPRNIKELATSEQFQATNTQTKKIENEIAQNLQEDLQDSIDYIASSLGEITNVSSANTAVEEISKAVNRIEELTKMADTMPLSVKKILAQQVNQNIPRLQALTKNATDIPEVGEIIKPVINKLSTSLTKLL